jgi:hypothetical protein
MFVIKYFNSKTETEYICDVVENYENLVIYFNKLIKLKPSLKPIQNIPVNSHIGYLIPILGGNCEEYYIERYEFVIEPSNIQSVYNTFKGST